MPRMHRNRLMIHLSKFKRLYVQTLTAVLSNNQFANYMTGKIYTGNAKMVCVPTLNCYSCPGAVGGCPIGALQAVLGSPKYNFSFYVLGTMALFGVLLGRLVCGFLCPFGFVQDLLYKIRVPKHDMPLKIDSKLRYLKYLILVIFVIALPIFLTDQYGTAAPYFCEFICPSGTLGAGIPLLIKNESLRSLVGLLFGWKMLILVAIVGLSMITYRPFCKYLCPLGAFYAFFNKISFYQIKFDENKCIHCKTCARVCNMQVNMPENLTSLECIRCGDCITACPTDALSTAFEITADKPWSIRPSDQGAEPTQ